MVKCAYCKADRKPTKEHIIPNWYCCLDPSSEGERFLERAPSKFLSDDAVIKDVCAKCNNDALSSLDAYGKELYELFFKYPVFRDDSVGFKFEYDRLVRWLLKLSYNSARVHDTDRLVLDEYACSIIQDQPVSDDIIIYCSIISAVTDSLDGLPRPAQREHFAPWIPEWFRAGVFRLQGFDSIDWCFRTVTINAFSFFLFIPKHDSEFRRSRRKMLDLVKKTENLRGSTAPRRASEVG